MASNCFSSPHWMYTAYQNGSRCSCLITNEGKKVSLEDCVIYISDIRIYLSDYKQHLVFFITDLKIHITLFLNQLFPNSFIQKSTRDRLPILATHNHCYSLLLHICSLLCFLHCTIILKTANDEQITMWIYEVKSWLYTLHPTTSWIRS